MFPCIARCTNVSTAESNEESSSLDVRLQIMVDLTPKEWSKVKSDTCKRLAAYGFLKVGCTLQISGTTNKQDRDTFVKKKYAATAPKARQPMRAQ